MSLSDVQILIFCIFQLSSFCFLVHLIVIPFEVFLNSSVSWLCLISPYPYHAPSSLPFRTSYLQHTSQSIIYCCRFVVPFTLSVFITIILFCNMHVIMKLTMILFVVLTITIINKSFLPWKLWKIDFIIKWNERYRWKNDYLMTHILREICSITPILS